MSKKLNLDYIREQFEKEGYKLISDKYINNKIKLSYVCNNGHTHSIKFNDWIGGHRCPYCSNTGKPSIESIKASFESEQYIFLSSSYKNSKSKLNYICSVGHTHDTTWDRWQQRKRCPTCYKINSIGSGNCNWQGGVSYEPYCPVWSDKEYKDDIKLRDGNRCLNPCCDSNNQNDLVIHHIDYNKKNCRPNNLITVCKSCNGKANKDREWHESWYKAIINKRCTK